MGQRRVVARLWMPTLAALLLATAPAVRQRAPSDFAPTQAGAHAETFGVVPFGEALALGTSRFSVSEFSRIERSRLLPVAGGLVALGGLLAVAIPWRSSLGQRGSRTGLYPVRRIARPRAPPFQLA
jgi:hypothetical protein